MPVVSDTVFTPEAARNDPFSLSQRLAWNPGLLASPLNHLVLHRGTEVVSRSLQPLADLLTEADEA